MGFHDAHDEVQVPCRNILLIFLGHHLQRFGFGFKAALVIDERRLHFPVMDLVAVRVTDAGTRKKSCGWAGRRGGRFQRRRNYSVKIRCRW